MKPGLALIVLAVLTTASVQAADVYRWVDDQGKVHYGQSVPSGIKGATKVAVPPPSTPVAGDVPTSTDGAPPAADVSSTDVEAEKKALTRQKCDQAKAQLKTYDEARFMLTKGADGKDRRATPEEEATERVRVKREISANCGG